MSPWTMSAPRSAGGVSTPRPIGSVPTITTAPTAWAASASLGERGLECAGVAGGLDPDRGGVLVEHPGHCLATSATASTVGTSTRSMRRRDEVAHLGQLVGVRVADQQHRAAAGDAARHRQRGRCGLVAVVGGDVDDVLVEQFAHQRLVLEQRLETAVVLVGLPRVGGEELAAVDDLVDDRRHGVLVGAGAEEEPAGLDRAVAAAAGRRRDAPGPARRRSGAGRSRARARRRSAGTSA